MTSVAEIQQMYDAGEIAKAMAAVFSEVEEERPSFDPDIPELCAIRAWCHYRRKEWNDVRQWLNRAGETLRAKRLRAYMAAYVDKDDAVLRQIAQELGEDVGVQNALVIRARDADSNAVTLDELENVLAPFAHSREVDAANLHHNAARLLLAKGAREEHFAAALSLVDEALKRYGTDLHWHHRAAATHWRSVILERLDHRELAQRAAWEVVPLWEKAVELDPHNEAFKVNLENARRRAAEL